VLITFAGLVIMRGPMSPGSMGALLGLLGIALIIRERSMDRDDAHIAALFCALPFYYVLNMLLTGWDAGFLDKPGRLILGFLVYFAVSRCGISRQTLHWGTILGAVAAAVFSAVQVQMFNLTRVRAPMNAIPFGNYSLLLGVLSVAGWIVLQKEERTILLTSFSLLAAAAGLYASIASGTRGGLIAIPVLAWILTLSAAEMRHTIRLGIIAAVSVLLVAAFFAFPALHQRTMDELAVLLEYIKATPSETTQMTLSSIGLRLHMYRVGLEAFLSNPILGIGFATLSSYLALQEHAGTINPAIIGFTHLHSVVIDTLARGGILGMVVLVYFGFGFIRYFHGALVVSTDRDARYFALVGLVAISATLLFSLSNVLFPAIVGTNILLMTLAVPAGALAYRMNFRAAAHPCGTRRKLK
jgi:O-antigen ligase